jgi:hypothetical protein
VAVQQNPERKKEVEESLRAKFRRIRRASKMDAAALLMSAKVRYQNAFFFF